MLPRRALAVATVVAIRLTIAAAHAETIQISMENLVISPAAASAKVGDTVEWVNKDILAHTATARNGEWDVTLPPKKTGSTVLQKAGTIEYYCRFHPNMKATLTVAPQLAAKIEFDDLRGNRIARAILR